MDFKSLEGRDIITTGKYCNLREIGAGKFGCVYLAEQKIEDVFVREVAIKIIHENVNLSNQRKIFKDGIQLARILDESHDSEGKRFIPRLYDMGILELKNEKGESEKHGYIVMEYIRGSSLEVIINNTKRQCGKAVFPAERVLRYAKQLCKALRVLHNHESPVIHQDIKPNNIIITSDIDEVRLVDFGLAATLSDIFGWKFGVEGVVSYMAPETLMGKSTRASDVYSLGLTLYQLLTGIHPFVTIKQSDGKPDKENLNYHYTTRKELYIKAPSELNVTMDKRVDKLIMRCLTFSDIACPDGRYQSAERLLEAIESLETSEDPRNALYGEGVKEFMVKNYEKALICFNKIIEQSGRDDDLKYKAKWYKAKCYIYNDNTLKIDEAIVLLMQVEKYYKEGFLRKEKRLIELYDDFISAYTLKTPLHSMVDRYNEKKTEELKSQNSERIQA